MSASGEKVIDGVRSGKMTLGDEVAWSARHFGIPWRMSSKITAYDPPKSFVDEMQKGPFRRWWHLHRFEHDDGGTLMVDEVEYSLPLGPLGQLVDALVLRRYLAMLLSLRNEHILRLAEDKSAGTAS